MVEGIPTYRQVLQDRSDLFNKALAGGLYTPFILPWDTIPALLLLVGILFTSRIPSPYGRYSRICLYVLQLAYSLSRWPYARTVSLLAGGYGIGLSGFWGLIATPILLIVYDPGTDFTRIEVRENGAAVGAPQPRLTDSEGGKREAQPHGLRKRHHADTDGDSNHVSIPRTSSPTRQSHYVWQPYPSDFWHRLDWSADLMTSFRGINWNWRIPIRTYVVSPPSLKSNPPSLSTDAVQANRNAPAELRRSAIRNFIYYYIIIDLLKTFMVTDPYWLGISPLSSRSPWPWLASLNDSLPGATRFVRLSVSLASVVSALTIIFSLSPLIFAVVLPWLLGDKLYTITKSPLLEVWMYPPQWGSMFESLCNRGLAGMWSTWWHQMFRYGISEPSRLLARKLNIPPKSAAGRALQLFVAFGLTAGIHTAASSTTFSVIPSKPWYPFMFFISQAVGILVQTELAQRLGRLRDWPLLVGQAANFGFVFVFLWYTGPLLSDDFARCQIWLFEPIPISFFRGLGFGPGDCWFPWLHLPEGGRTLGWWNGGSWYNSGIGIY